MKNIQVIVIMVGLLLTASAVGAVNYPTYKPTTTPVGSMSPQAQTTTNPSDLTPMLNEDGSAVDPYAGAPAQAGARISGPRRVEVDGDWGDDPTAPIGSPLVMLLFAAMAAAVAWRRKTAMTK